MPVIWDYYGQGTSATTSITYSTTWTSLTYGASTSGTYTVPVTGATWWQAADTARDLTEYRRQAAEAARRRRAAEARALELLLSLLDDQQARSYQERRWFEVTGSDGGRYRIRRDGQAGNIEELDAAGELAATWCIHPPGSLPDADAHVAQLLHLQTDEPGFRQTGNRTPRRHQAAAAA